jgi:mRNA-degrading endonuclease RelE of RelBE toxin-antitoxin system
MAVKYSLYLEPEVHASRAELPGYVRQHMRARIADLATIPRPPDSKELEVADLGVPAGVEIRRIRLGHWRIVYAIHDSDRWVWVLTIRRRPPYNYADLADLIDRLA